MSCDEAQLLLKRPDMPLALLDDVLKATTGEHVTFTSSRALVGFIDSLDSTQSFHHHNVQVDGQQYGVFTRDLRSAVHTLLKKNRDFLINPAKFARQPEAAQDHPQPTIYHCMEGARYAMEVQRFRLLHPLEEDAVLVPLTFFSGVLLLECCVVVGMLHAL